MAMIEPTTMPITQITGAVLRIVREDQCRNTVADLAELDEQVNDVSGEVGQRFVADSRFEEAVNDPFRELELGGPPPRN